MVFRRRTPKTYVQRAQDVVYPRGGWLRAATYTWYRLRRLPDRPHRIARGVGAGIFISFTPLFGAHFFGGGILAWIIGGNVLAALVGTFVGNPVTFPFIAYVSMRLGGWMLGIDAEMRFHRLVAAFSHATQDLWDNFLALFAGEAMHWSGLKLFYDNVFLPYMLGGCVLGLIAAVAGHYLTLPVIAAYQKRRTKKLRERAEKLRAAARTRAELAAEASPPPPAPLAD
ncbi:DUF2062 domain-containing protein [Frigidibacter sp. MR17.14]|uniref:DUF2062 domain-containing protein n=1 Tax=Frigidibacter sp. MR17.14 TaxID=3126509 RepID=UPI003012DCDA